MRIILYLDIVFFINFVADLYSLLLAGFFLKQQIRWFRLFGGAMFGTGMLLPFVLYPERLMGLEGIFWSAGISMGAVWIALGRKGGLVKKWTLTTTILILLGGLMNVLRNHWNLEGGSLGVWTLFFACCGTAIWIVLWNMQDVLHKRKQLYPFQIKRGNVKMKGTFLLDTGNMLRDGLFGKPVVVLSSRFLNTIFTAEEKQFIQLYQEKGYMDYQYLVSMETQKSLCFHEIAYQSVGNPSGKLLCFLADEIILLQNKRVLQRQPVAMGAELLFEKADYDGLLFGDGWE